MVKRQREKQYNSAREQRDYSQIRSGAGGAASLAGTAGSVQRTLPFGHCSLTLLRIADTPVCNRDGILYENASIMPFVMRHKVDPVSGRPLTTSELITLNVDVDEESGKWQCPVLTKHLTSHTKVVAVLQPDGKQANVYSYQAYHELNVKSKSYVDLTTSEPFNPKTDVIVLNDPDNDEWMQSHRTMDAFYHIRHGKELGLDRRDQEERVRHSKTSQRILDQLQQQSEKKQKALNDSSIAAAASASSSTENLAHKLQILASDVLGVEYTTGKASASLTSTAMPSHSAGAGGSSDRRLATNEELLQSQMKAMRSLKKKGYVRMHVSYTDKEGDKEDAITLELHCDMAPRTCINFLGLCRQGRYDSAVFHRLIPNFMIQGGKALDGNDASYWGPDEGGFADEFDDRLKHSGSGILSMANSGPGTNRQQFFVTFKSCPHLDRKHSVFGRVVADDDSDSMRALQRWQSCPVDSKDRPKRPIRIVRTEVLVDPAREAEELELARFERLAAARKATAGGSKTNGKSGVSTASSSKDISSGGGDSTVGRYLQDRLRAAASGGDASSPKAQASSSAFGGNANDHDGDNKVAVVKRHPPAPTTTKFGNFGDW
jgi:peptidyl-prolyl cis-trans isomerase-like 2